jgi:hypothetical protein
MVTNFKQMKNLTLLILILGIGQHFIYAQSVGIAKDEITPHPSAALEIRSNEKGLLIPRMTSANKNAIEAPAIGLLIYQIDGAKGFYYSDGNNWNLLEGTSGTIDSDTTNEIQTIRIDGDTLFISKGGYALLPKTSGSNEQTLSINSDTLFISNGNYVIIPAGADNLGDHTASQNIQLKSYYISSDGDDEGISVSTNGNVQFSHNISVSGNADLSTLQVSGDVSLGANAIQSGELDVLSVTSSKIADDAITTSKIMDAQVTAAKLHPMGASTDQFLRFNGTSWAPASISSGLNYMGTWNASNNTPSINDATGVNGQYYIVSTAGSQNLGSGVISFDVGDWAVHNGSAYQKINNSNDVNSVFGRTGIITAQYGDYSWNQINLTSSSLNGLADVNSSVMTTGNLLISDGTQWVSRTLAGDLTLSGTGNLQIKNGVVTYSNLQDATGTDNTILKWNGAQWQEVLISSIEGDGSPTNEIQNLSLTGNALGITDGNTVNLAGYLDNTDAQQLTLSGTSLSIQNGNSVDLSPLVGTSTDDQNLSLSNDTLYIEDGNYVLLRPYVNTDSQKLSLNVNDLSIDNGNTISLAGYLDNTDAQTLTLTSNNLSIENGNSVPLGPYLDNTDNQLLDFNKLTDTLTIQNGNKVGLGSLKDNLGNHTLTSNLITNGYFLSLDGTNQGIYVGENGWVGIGNAKPDYKLHLTEDEKSYMRIDNSSLSADGVLQIAMTQIANPNFSNDFIKFIAQGNTVKGSISGSLGGVSYNTTSDRRLKENLKDTKYGLGTIMNMKVYDYNFIGSEQQQTGFMAQELHQQFPQAVSVGGKDPKTDPWTVDYSKITPVLTKAIQEMNVRLSALEEKNQQLEQENASLKQELENLQSIEKRLSELEKNMKNN